MAKTKRTQEDRWQPVFYETARGERPAWEFLTSKKTPSDVRIELLTTVRAVLQVGPPRFPTSTQRWRLMHKPANKKEVDLSGICEARDKHSNKLYRLFCVIDQRRRHTGWRCPRWCCLAAWSSPREQRRRNLSTGESTATARTTRRVTVLRSDMVVSSGGRVPASICHSFYATIHSPELR